MKNIRFVYWTMDLQPELSLVAGYMKAGSIPAKSMQKCGDYVFHQSDKIIVLDDYMKQHINRRLHTEKWKSAKRPSFVFLPNPVLDRR